MTKYIVRADFYPSGEIRPLGITDGYGDTVFIQKSKEAFSNSDGTKGFQCLTNKGQFFLIFKNGKWDVTD